jgi:outer membrane immunogenic protein
MGASGLLAKGAKMKKLLVAAAVAAVAFCARAVAADIPVKAPVAAPAAPYDPWTGCYVGGNVGGGWSHINFFDHSGNPEGGHTADGWVGGGQVGCDYRAGNNWIVGVQGMWDSADVKGSNFSTRFPANDLTSKTRSFSAVTGQLGYLLNRATELYGKAGIGRVHDDFACTAGSCAVTFATGSKSGFDLGIGVAWAFTRNWSAFVEYDRLWVDHNIVHFPGFDEQIHQKLDKVLVGINYRFDPWGKAPVVAKY